MTVNEFFEFHPERLQMFRRAVDSLAGELRQKKAYHDKHGAYIDAYVTLIDELHDTLNGNSAPVQNQQASQSAAATGRNARQELAQMYLRMSHDYARSDPGRSRKCLENAERITKGLNPISIY